MDTKERRIQLGLEISRRRQEQGLSQRKLALMVGTNQTHLWKIETGQTSVGMDLLCRIADGLGTTVHDIVKF